MPPKYNSPAATVPMVSVGTLQRLKTFRFTKVQAPLNKACAEENEEQTSAPKRRAVCSDVTNATNAMATHLSPKPVRDAAVDLSLSPVASVSTPTDCHSHRDEHTMTVNRVVSSVTTMGEDRQTPEVVRAGVSRFKETIKGTSGGTSGVPSWVTIGVPSGGSSGVSSERTVRSLAGGMAGGTSGVVSSRGFEHETHTKEQLFDDFDMETFLADIDPDPLVPTDTPPSPSLPLSPAQQKAASGTSAAMVTFSSRTFPGNLGPASRHVQVAATQVPSKNVPPVPVAAPTGQSHPCVPREVALHPLPPLPSTGVATPGDPGVIQLEATLTPPCKSPTSMLMCRKFPGPAGVLQRQVRAGHPMSYHPPPPHPTPFFRHPSHLCSGPRTGYRECTSPVTSSAVCCITCSGVVLVVVCCVCRCVHTCYCVCVYMHAFMYFGYTVKVFVWCACLCTCVLACLHVCMHP